MPIYVTHAKCDKLLDEEFGKVWCLPIRTYCCFLKPYPLMGAPKNLVTGSNLFWWFAALPLRTKIATLA